MSSRSWMVPEAEWSRVNDKPPPPAPTSHRQKVWNFCRGIVSADMLLEAIPNAQSRARTLAATIKEAGPWLHAFPFTSLSLWMMILCMQIGVDLHLWRESWSSWHSWSDTHSLNSWWSERCHYCHAAINDVPHRALSTAKTPSCLEPSGLRWSNEKRPDGVSVVPWKSGKLVWYATSPDTCGPSYFALASTEAGLVTGQAEDRKWAKYLKLTTNHIFTSVAIETSCIIGPQSMKFICEIGFRLKQVTGNTNSLHYLNMLQWLSITVQQGNSTLLLGSSGPTHFNVNNCHLQLFFCQLVWLFLHYILAFSGMTYQFLIN